MVVVKYWIIPGKSRNGYPGWMGTMSGHPWISSVTCPPWTNVLPS